MIQGFLLAECLISCHYLQKLKQEEFWLLLLNVRKLYLDLGHGVNCCLASVLSNFFFFQEFEQLQKKQQPQNTQTKPDTKKWF